MMTYKLDYSLPALGINREDFTSPFNAVINASSSYKNTSLYSLMKYQDEGDYYNFEDDFISIYDPTEPTQKSHCFIRIKPITFLENEKTIFYIDSRLDGNYDSYNTSISFEIFYKATQNSYVGCLITPQHYIDVLHKAKEIDELYLLPNFHEKIVKEINPNSIEKVFEDISKTEGGWRNNDFLRLLV